MTSFTLSQLQDGNEGFRLEMPYQGPKDRKDFHQVLNVAADNIAENGAIMVDHHSYEDGKRGFEIMTALPAAEVRQIITQRLPSIRR